MYQNALENINDFFQIQQGENFGFEVFSMLSKIIKFKSGYIFFTNPKRLEYSYNPEPEINAPALKEELKLKNTVFGEIIITGENFSADDKKIFKTCASVIANITKDFEISKIIKMQVQALQDVYLEVQKNNVEIKEAEEVKTKFLSHISHELRTPLNSILGYSDLLGNEFIGELNEKQKEYINDIKVSGLNLLEMINEILDMSKIEANMITLNKREFDITILINEVVNTIKPLIIKKNIAFINNSQSVNINADYQKIQQILFNLLSNAIKFTPENGEITISADELSDKIIISVKDNGIGIAKRNHSKIFKKFEQVGESKEASTGLGLAITKELVKLHKGKIYVESAKGKGAKFIVELPKERG